MHDMHFRWPHLIYEVLKSNFYKNILSKQSDPKNLQKLNHTFAAEQLKNEIVPQVMSGAVFAIFWVRWYCRYFLIKMGIRNEMPIFCLCGKYKNSIGLHILDLIGRRTYFRKRPLKTSIGWPLSPQIATTYHINNVSKHFAYLQNAFPEFWLLIICLADSLQTNSTSVKMPAKQQTFYLPLFAYKTFQKK